MSARLIIEKTLDIPEVSDVASSHSSDNQKSERKTPLNRFQLEQKEDSFFMDKDNSPLPVAAMKDRSHTKNSRFERQKSSFELQSSDFKNQLF